VRHILILLSFLLSSPLLGQSSKPLGVVLPPTVIGNVPDSQKQILLNTLDDELSKYFDVSSPPQIESGDCLVGCDVFQLQIVEEDGDTQLSLRWESGNYRRIETKLCVGCKTIELDVKLRKLVGKLVGRKKVETVVMDDKSRKGVLFVRLVSGEFRWFEDGDDDKDGKYVGEIENGEPSGQGSFTWPDGDKYVGDFKEGRKSGQGTLTLSSGNKYEGEFKEGKYHGQGTFTWSDGDRYVGEFRDGKKQGQGTYIKPDGRKYVGEWKGGLKNGPGTLTYGKAESEGDKYTGEFKDGKKHNQGIYTYSSGDKYVGEYKNNKHHGYGIYTHSNGDKYVGEFKDGKQHGQGTYIKPEGRKYEGEWKDGLKNGQGTLTYGKGESEGGKYVGEFKDGKQHGKGTLTSRFEKEYIGEFKDGTFWNITEYDKNGNILTKTINGEKQQ